MTSLKNYDIDGKKLSVGKFGAIEGWRLLHKLSNIIAPSLACAKDDSDWSKAVNMFFEKLSEDELIALIQQLTGITLINEKKPEFSKDFSDYMFTIKVCQCVLEYNFGEFFLQIAEQLDSVLQGTLEKLASKKMKN